MESIPELNFLSALFPFAITVFIIAVGVILLNQHFRKNLTVQRLKAEEIKTRHHRELLKSSIDAQERERKRIANDLHDELGAVLSIARMHLVQLEDKNTTAADMRPSLQNIRSLTESALSSMRRISHELMPPQLEVFGIIKTLQALAERTNTANSIRLNVIAHEELPDLNWSIQLGLYRICLELITNTIKHAKATEITITFFTRSASLVVNYSDNGIGISSTPSVSGLGMKNLEARISALSGTFKTNDLIVNGFNVTLEIPLNGNHK